MPRDQIALLVKIRQESEAGKQPKDPNPSVLPLNAIKQEPDFFQPRNIDQTESQRHIDSLVIGIKNEQSGCLEPVTVWWSGKRWLLIDGHHRISAYKKAYAGKTAPPIPVSVVLGDWADAYQQSMMGNSKDKLPVRRQDKFNRAWRMVVLELGSITKIKSVCGISERTVSNMRTELGKVKQRNPEGWISYCLNRTWSDIKRAAAEPQDYDDDYVEKQAEDFRQRLGKEFGNKLFTQPEVTARALELYSPALVRNLVEIWGDLDSEELEE